MYCLWHLWHEKSMKYSDYRKLWCELSNLWKLNVFNLFGFWTNTDFFWFTNSAQRELFQYVRRVYATAINFPCIITLPYTILEDIFYCTVYTSYTTCAHCILFCEHTVYFMCTHCKLYSACFAEYCTMNISYIVKCIHNLNFTEYTPYTVQCRKRMLYVYIVYCTVYN